MTAGGGRVLTQMSPPTRCHPGGGRDPVLIGAGVLSVMVSLGGRLLGPGFRRGDGRWVWGGARTAASSMLNSRLRGNDTVGWYSLSRPLDVIPAKSRDPFLRSRLAVRWVLGSSPRMTTEGVEPVDGWVPAVAGMTAGGVAQSSLPTDGSAHTNENAGPLSEAGVDDRSSARLTPARSSVRRR